MKYYKLFYSLLLLFLVIAGCAPKLQRTYPERNYYILNVSNENQSSPPISESVLEVRRFRISPSFSDREFVYRQGDLSYVSDFYNQFFRPPALLITGEVRKWLSESGLFKYVVDSTGDVESSYTLEGNVSELYGDFRTPGTPKAVLAVQFFLIDDTGTNPEIIFQNNYRKEVALRANSSEALIEAWNEALKQILKSLEGDLRELTLKRVSLIDPPRL